MPNEAIANSGVDGNSAVSAKGRTSGRISVLLQIRGGQVRN
jgi:hypothetical protein